MDWKDSLNLPVSAQGEWAAKRFYGDPELAAQYLPVAYALLGAVKNRMALGGVGYGHQMLELPDGTRIRVLRNGNQNILEIAVTSSLSYSKVYQCSFYLESGKLEFFIPPLLQRKETDPALIHTVTTDLSEPPPKEVMDKVGVLFDKAACCGEKSLAFGRPLRDEYSLFPVLNADQQRELDEEGEKLYLLFRASRVVPASLFTGKMQMYVQAKFGRANARDIISLVEGPGITPYLNIDGSSCIWYHGKVTGIFTDAETYDYYMVYVSGVISVQKLNKSPCGQIISNFLINNKNMPDEEKRKLEAYILSTSTPSGVIYDKIYQKNGESLVSMKGTPEGTYGVHFNWLGDQSDIITHEPLDEDLRTFKARHYRIKLSINEAHTLADEEDKINIPPLLYELDKLEEVFYTRRLSDRIWHYNHTIGKLLLSISKPRNADDLMTVNFPVYCYYDNLPDSKDPFVVRMASSKVERFAADSLPQYPQFRFGVCGYGTAVWETEGTSMDGFDYTVTLNVVKNGEELTSVSTITKYGVHEYFSRLSITVEFPEVVFDDRQATWGGSVTTVGLIAGNCGGNPDFEIGTPVRVIRYMTSPTGVSQTSYVGTQVRGQSGNVTLVIPKDNANAVYIGEFNSPTRFSTTEAKPFFTTGMSPRATIGGDEVLYLVQFNRLTPKYPTEYLERGNKSQIVKFISPYTSAGWEATDTDWGALLQIGDLINSTIDFIIPTSKSSLYNGIIYTGPDANFVVDDLYSYTGVGPYIGWS